MWGGGKAGPLYTRYAVLSRPAYYATSYKCSPRPLTTNKLFCSLRLRKKNAYVLLCSLVALPICLGKVQQKIYKVKWLWKKNCNPQRLNRQPSKRCFAGF